MSLLRQYIKLVESQTNLWFDDTNGVITHNMTIDQLKQGIQFWQQKAKERPGYTFAADNNIRAYTRAIKQLEQNGGVNPLAGQPKPDTGIQPGKSVPGQIGLDWPTPTANTPATTNAPSPSPNQVPSKNTSEIKVANKNPSVEFADLQKGLIALYGEEILPQHGVDGYYGQETAAAVQKFQQDNNLDVTGRPTKPVVDKLNLLLKQNGLNITPSTPAEIVAGKGGQANQSTAINQNAAGSPQPQDAEQGTPTQTAIDLQKALTTIESILAKYQVKVNESFIFENINSLSPSDQMRIWTTLVENNVLPFPGTTLPNGRSSTGLPTYPTEPRFDFPYYSKERKDWEAQQEKRKADTTTGTPKKQNTPASKIRSNRSRAFVSRMSRTLAPQLMRNAAAAPTATTGVGTVLNALLWAYTAYEAGKLVYDYFTSTDLSDLEPSDQEAIKQAMTVVLKYEKDKEAFKQLPLDIQTRVGNAIKGLTALAAQDYMEPENNPKEQDWWQKTKNMIGMA